MTVYIEDAFFDNLLINFLILNFTSKTLNQKTKKIFYFLSSFLGAVGSVVFAFLYVKNSFLLLCLKLLLGILMTFLAVEKFNFKSVFTYFILFLTYTFLFGGFCFFVMFALGYEDISSYSTLPSQIRIVLLLLIVYMFFLKNVLNVIKEKNKISNFYYDVMIKTEGKSVKFKAYLDTGNLYCDEGNKPVLIIDFFLLEKMFKGKINLIDFATNRLDKKISGNYIDFLSVNNSSKMFVFSANHIYIKSKKGIKNRWIEINSNIGVMSKNSFKNQDFSALLSPFAVANAK